MTTISATSYCWLASTSPRINVLTTNVVEMVSAAHSTFYCQNCRRCIASCPKGVEIPTLMRAYMYSEGYGNLAQASSTVDELSPARSVDACGDCPACTATCKNGINIAQRLKVLKKGRLCRA